MTTNETMERIQTIQRLLQELADTHDFGEKVDELYDCPDHPRIEKEDMLELKGWRETQQANSMIEKCVTAVAQAERAIETAQKTAYQKRLVHERVQEIESAKIKKRQDKKRKLLPTD